MHEGWLCVCGASRAEARFVSLTQFILYVMCACVCRVDVSALAQRAAPALAAHTASTPQLDEVRQSCCVSAY